MADFPALMLWTDKYLADTRHLSTLEHGAYLLLIMEAWRRPHCDLPDDDLILSRMAGLNAKQWADVKPVVMAFWDLDKRRKSWRQKKLTSERDYVTKKRKSQQDKAAKRWKDREKADAAALPRQSRGNAPTPTPTPTHSIIPFPNGKGPDSAPDFELELVGGDAPPEDDDLTVEEVVDAWNKLAKDCGLPKVAKLTEARKRQVSARIRENSFDEWTQALAAIRRSRFLLGDNQRGWRANFDFLLQPSSFTKLLEGAYDEQTASR